MENHHVPILSVGKIYIHPVHWSFSIAECEFFLFFFGCILVLSWIISPTKSYCNLLARDQQTTKVSRFRQKLWDGAKEIPDDQVFTCAPARVQRVKLELLKKRKKCCPLRRTTIWSLEYLLRCIRDRNTTAEDCSTHSALGSAVGTWRAGSALA